MKGSNIMGESSDQFFDSVEYFLPCEEEFDYGVWVNEPTSVEERRENFLRVMGSAEFTGSSRLEGERLCEASRAVSTSCDMDSDSVEESSGSSSTESGIDEQELIEDSEKDQENESPSSWKCRQPEKQEAKSTSKRKFNRWWSYPLNRRSNLVADSLSARPDHRERSKSPVMSKLKVQHKQKRSKEFTGLYSGQEIRAHSGIIWTMKFSPDGHFLASGGSDRIVRVWRVNSADAHFNGTCFSEGGKVKRGKFISGRKGLSDSVLIPSKVFWIDESPVQEFQGHTGDILDLAWSNSNCLLSSSTDKTVRLWNLGSDKCLDVFLHIDYVTCIQFNPVQENYFVSGSLDGKVRVWGVSERRVVDWADVRDVITAICYQPNGKVSSRSLGFAVGSVVGTCHLFSTSGVHLQLNRIIDIEGRKKTSNRITSIQFSQVNSGRVMITSEDGKIRVLEGSDIIQKYKGNGQAIATGLAKSGSQLSASFSSSGKHIVSVGDDSRVYLWNYDGSSVPPSKSKTMKSVRSCELFISEAASVALPWSSTGADQSLLGINSSKLHQYCPTRLGHPSGARDSDQFSIGNWLSIEGSCLGTATWPEEKLPQWELTEEEGYEFQQTDERYLCREETKDDHIRVPETWGLVIVTASFDGKIRTFHNYGLPERL